MNKFLTPVLAVAAVGGAVFAFTQWNARSVAEAVANEKNAKITALEKAASDALEAAKRARDDADAEAANVARLKKERDDALEKSRQVAGIETAPANPAAPGGAPDAKNQFDLRNIMTNLAKGMDDPEQRKNMKTMQERMISGAYEKVFTKLGINEADTKLVSELLAERNFVAMDQGRKLLTGATDAASVAKLREDINATKTEYDGKLKAVLGPQKFAELSSFEQSVGDQRTVDSFARDLQRKGQSLDDSQKERLLSIIQEERAKSPTNEIPDLGGGPGMSVLMSDDEIKAQQAQEEAIQSRIASRASQAGLTPDQVSVLTESQKRQNERKAWARTMGRAFLMPK